MSWEYDIDSFERWKRFLGRVKNREMRQRVIGYLREIQTRWPRYIKESEIPNE